jgi:hypothetical protein
MEPASNFRNSAAVPFCSHSKIINASLANYDTAGFKLGQLLETGAAEAVATIRHGIISSGSNRPEQVHSLWDRSGDSRSQKAARRMRNGDAVIITRSSDNIIRTHKHRSRNKRELPFGATNGDAQH